MKENKLKNEIILKDRIKTLISAICSDMYEREEVIAVTLLAAISGQNTFLYGPPGTAKSLISRRIACAFETSAYFEYLMNRFSTPEEVFGPVSLKALKEDQYLRKTDSYLPKAEFAFLDEIWKSSPAILNTLLTLINERTFRNGDAVQDVPLKALIAASNETPDVNQGLEALYDRFIVRLLVAPIREPQHFEQLLNSKPSSPMIAVPESLRICTDEWSKWLNEFHTVTLSPETLTIIRLVRGKLAGQQASLQVCVSDRRWQRAAMLMKAAAFFNGRSETNHSDALLMQHCLWTNDENRQTVADIVAESVKDAGIESGYSLADIDRKKASLDVEIQQELYHSDDVYETTTGKDGTEFFCFKPNHQFFNSYLYDKSIYIPCDKLKTDERFIPVDENGNPLQPITCQFDGQGTCDILYRGQRIKFTPEILFRKGTKKQKVNPRLISSLRETIVTTRSSLMEVHEKMSNRFALLQTQLDSVFVPADKTGLAIEGIQEQINQLELRIADCERLEKLC